MRSVFSSAAKRTTSRSRIAQHISASGSQEDERQENSNCDLPLRNNDMSDVIMDIDQGLKIPGRVINLDQARVQHGDKADHMVRMLAVGDPPADAVIGQVDAVGKGGPGNLRAR